MRVKILGGQIHAPADAAPTLEVELSRADFRCAESVPTTDTVEYVRSMFARARRVVIRWGMDTAIEQALCDVLMRPDCKIEELKYYCGATERADVGAAVAINTSLRRFILVTDLNSRIMRKAVLNTSIRFLHLCLSDVEDIALYHTILQMPSLLCLAGGDFKWWATINTQWPDRVLVYSRSVFFPDCVDAVWRSRDAMTAESRQLVYALYECADGVLPDTVIEDIACKIRKLKEAEYLLLRCWPGSRSLIFLLDMSLTVKCGDGVVLTYEYDRHLSSDNMTRCFNETLRAADDAPCVDEVCICGYLMRGMLMWRVDFRLLQRVFANARRVIVAEDPPYGIDNGVTAVLCKALGQPDCMIETLSTFHVNSFHASQLARAMTRNKSVRRILLSSEPANTFFACCANNTTIEEVITEGFSMWRAWGNLLRTILAHSTVRYITIQDADAQSVLCLEWYKDITRSVWPECVFTKHYSTILKTPDVVPLDKRRVAYALYECLEGVLPDGVIGDIVARS